MLPSPCIFLLEWGSQSQDRVRARQLWGRFGVPDWDNASLVRSLGLTTSLANFAAVTAGGERTRM